MRIYETKHDDLDEGPLDLLTPSGRERRRAFKTGNQDSATAIKQLGNEFARYLGTQGKRNFNQADTQDVIAFLKSKGVDTADIDTTQPMNQKRIENIFKQKVQQTTSLNRLAPAPQSQKTTKSSGDKSQNIEKPRVPAKLLAALQALTPEEKKKLAELL